MVKGRAKEIDRSEQNKVVEKCLNSTLKHLADAIDKKGLKVQFGLEAQGHIETIETELARWNDGSKVEMRYTKEVWEQIGNKIGWLPFTAALSYWRYLDNRNQRIRKV